MALQNMSVVAPILALGLFLTIQCFQLPTPALLKASRSLFEKRKGDRSHWCCKKDLSPVVTQFTRKQVQRYIVSKNYTYVTDYKPCDPNDVNNTLLFCPVHKTDIVKTPMYRMVTVMLNRTETPSCKEKDLTCCKGFSLYLDNCYEPEELKTIKALAQLGLTG
ncbi:uncharacterized protein LOC135471976 [Liolophura sinensis]|uniref:uncharacterized protein LOC135471976 n=1 Tax=Liolophura sinensis TaxID=3198878 RepID=UPI00315838EC